jgi:hypothetical protein
MQMHFDWNDEKNEHLKNVRNICFEQIVLHIERGDLLGTIPHPNSKKYPNQKVFIVNINDYAYFVPFIETKNVYFLKTIIPSRKATKEYIGGNK